jgi:hypothetical protein
MARLRDDLRGSREKPRPITESRNSDVVGGGLFLVVMLVLLAGMAFLAVFHGLNGPPIKPSDDDPLPEIPSRWSCTPPAYGRTVSMPGVLVVSGNTTLTNTLSPQILLCEPGARIHFGNASTTENGARVLVRPLDSELVCSEFYNMGVHSRCKARDHVIVSCEQSGCELFVDNRRCGLMATALSSPSEYLFVAEWNAWYEL